MIVATVVGAACGSEVDTASGTVAPVVTSPVTTSPVTTSPVTTSPVTTSPVTTSPVTTTPAAPSGIDGAWTAVAGTVDGVPVDVVAPITLEIAGTSFSGSSGCNTYEYTVGIDGATVTFLEGFNTEIGCSGPVTEMESLYVGSIGPVAEVEQSGTTLVLQNERATWTFEWVPPTPNAPFAGTRWGFSMLIDEFGAMSFSEAVDAFLLFEDDGTVTGSNGCEPIDGTWFSYSVGALARIRIDTTAPTPCAGDLAGLSDAMQRLLDEGFAPSITENQLRAMIDDTTGIGFVAA